MSKSEPPTRVGARAVAPTRVAPERIARGSDEAADPALAKSIHRQLSIIDGLRGDIDAVWNEAPDTLVMLAEWSDALAIQSRDLRALLTEAERRTDPVGAVGRLGRDIAREAAAAFSKDARLRRLAMRGHRLVDVEAAAASLEADPARRVVIERHRAANVRHLGRLQGRIAPVG